MVGKRGRVMMVASLFAIGGIATTLKWLSKGPLRPEATERTNPETPKMEKPKPCRATFEQVAKGMTRGEVATTLGGPPGVYAHGELGSDIVLAPRGLGWTSYDQWVADDGELLVWFGDDGRVSEVHIWGVWVRPR
ncbi:MAG: hypothetical protein JWO38_419 [Gemmataceae bacterium]|nr:hypothetical protein [Gemmataceae bacterium]